MEKGIYLIISPITGSRPDGLDRWRLGRGSSRPICLRKRPLALGAGRVRDCERGEMENERARERDGGGFHGAPQRSRRGPAMVVPRTPPDSPSTDHLLHIPSCLSTPPLLHRTSFTPPSRSITTTAAASSQGSGCELPVRRRERTRET